MDSRTEQDNQKLIEHWDRVFSYSAEEPDRKDLPDWNKLAPSDKLFQAAASLGIRKRILDYGCGNAWASIIAAKSGCPDVTAAEIAPHAAEAARTNAALYGVENSLHVCRIDAGWLKTLPAASYDGFICSNVLDVIPPKTAEEIIRESARIVSKGAPVIIGMNYWLSPGQAAERGITLVDGRKVYVDGILRLVSRSDEEWLQILARYFEPERTEHFAWPGEKEERRRLFFLRGR